MGCERCGYTGVAEQYEPEAGFVDVPCSECRGTDGDMPDPVADLHDALTEDDIEVERHTQYGLDAAGFLLLAEGHLVRAGQKLLKDRGTIRISQAERHTVAAIKRVRDALALLKEEEPGLDKAGQV